MYEHKTFENILENLLKLAKNEDSNIDTREGSILYNILAPCAVELANMYIQLDTVLNETFADTASRSYLIQRAKERGIEIKNETNAIRQGEFNIDVPIGSRFSLNKLNYIVTEKIDGSSEIKKYKLKCETSGIVGNLEIGTLIPIDDIEGLTLSELTEVLIPAENAEDTEVFRQRYFESLNGKSFGGNVSAYKEKVNEIDGVAGVKVIRAWNGGGTVKLVIINSDYQTASSTLIDKVQSVIDPTQNQGEGLGIAPIGHVVTVESVNTTDINIVTNITFNSGWNYDNSLTYLQDAINEYFLDLAKQWNNTDNLIVRISYIEQKLLELDYVLDVANTTINGVANNLTLDSYSIPKLGDLQCTET